jgi:hypothetical protein
VRLDFSISFFLLLLLLSDRVSHCLLPGLASNCSPPTFSCRVAGTIDVFQYASPGSRV